MVQPTFIFYIN